MEIDARDIGVWVDDHPLNHHDTQKLYFRELFAIPRNKVDTTEEDRAFGQPHRGHPSEEQ